MVRRMQQVEMIIISWCFLIKIYNWFINIQNAGIRLAAEFNDIFAENHQKCYYIRRGTLFFKENANFLVKVDV